MPSFVNTLRRCHSTVRGLRNSSAPISGFVRPSPASRAMAASWAVSVGERRGGALAHRLAGGQQLPAGALGEPIGSHRGQHLVGGPELLACVQTALLAAQPFAVEQVRAGQFRPDPGAAEPPDRLPVQPVGQLAAVQQRPRAGLDAERPVGAGGAGVRHQTRQRLGRAFGLAGPGRRFYQLDRRPGGQPELAGVLAALFGRGQRRAVAAQAVVQHRIRPVRQRHPGSLAAYRHLFPGDLDQRGSLAFPAPPGRQAQGAVGRQAAPGRVRRRLRLLDQ